MMTQPPPEAETSPEGRLLRLGRNAQGLSIRAAASRAGVSDTLWRHAEAGTYVSPGKLAPMMQAVSISADRLETEGERPDAAAILQERQARHAPSTADPAGRAQLRRFLEDMGLPEPAIQIALEMAGDPNLTLREILGAAQLGMDMRRNGDEERRRA